MSQCRLQSPYIGKGDNNIFCIRMLYRLNKVIIQVMHLPSAWLIAHSWLQMSVTLWTHWRATLSDYSWVTYESPESVGLRTDSKASVYNAGDLGSIPGSGRSPGEGNSNPLQYSCLGNPMDGGAWWPTVHGVEKSWTRLRDFTFTFISRTQCQIGNQ